MLMLEIDKKSFKKAYVNKFGNAWDRVKRGE